MEFKKSIIPSTRKLTGNDIVTFRPTYLEPRFVRPSFIVVFKTPLPRTQRRKDFLFVLPSRRENAIESMILESIIRDYTPEIVHRDEIHVWRCFAIFFHP